MTRCISPMSVRHPHGNKASVRMTVPCGRCMNCFQNKRADWTLRLLHELQNAESANFITLTYNPENEPWLYVNPVTKERYVESYKDHQEGLGSSELPTLVKKDIQEFLKRLRYRVDVLHKLTEENAGVKLKMLPLRYFIVGEYGPKSLRPHYHGILFNLPKNSDEWILNAWQKNKEAIGFVHLGKVCQASIHYTTKYVLDALLDTGSFSSLKDSKGKWIVEKPFSLMSRKPGLGAKYVTNSKDYHRNSEAPYYTYPGGVKQRLPRFYKEKIFSEKEREKYAKENQEEIDRKEIREHEERIHKELGEEYTYQQYENKKKNIIKKSKQRML